MSWACWWPEPQERMPLSPCRSPPLIARRLPPATGGSGAADPRRARATPPICFACISRMALLQIDTISWWPAAPIWCCSAVSAITIRAGWNNCWLMVTSSNTGPTRPVSSPGRLPAAAPSHAGSRRHGLEVLRPVAQDPRRRDRADSGAHTPGYSGAAADFERKGGKGNGWWDWKPEKRHLEVLFTAGQLMVRERRNFQRVYDLAERVMPEWNDERDLLSPDPPGGTWCEPVAGRWGWSRPAGGGLLSP